MVKRSPRERALLKKQAREKRTIYYAAMAKKEKDNSMKVKAFEDLPEEQVVDDNMDMHLLGIEKYCFLGDIDSDCYDSDGNIKMQD